MQTFKTLSDVIALAEFAHRNQTDKAGLPYIEHPRRVMQAVQAQGAFPYVQMAAILHDVTEDTAFTFDMLLDLGVPEAAVEIVGLLDRDRSEHIFRNSHPEWIMVSSREQRPVEYKAARDKFYYDRIRYNPGAKMVKLADIHDNLQEWRLSYLPPDTQDRLRTKYADAVRMLNTNF